MLTYACMATRWPQAIPLRTITARAVADGLIEIFSRTSLPMQILSDRGTQFTSTLLKELCELLGVDQIKTTAYNPQTNGVVERMHGTLGAMLTKAHSQGLDWTKQLPVALFALCQAPHRDTRLTPYELVSGRLTRTPLDVIYQGWRDKEDRIFNVSKWTEDLCDRLDVLRDIAHERLSRTSKVRKSAYDRGKVERSLNEGDLVFAEIPEWIKGRVSHGMYPLK